MLLYKKCPCHYEKGDFEMSTICGGVYGCVCVCVVCQKMLTLAKLLTVPTYFDLFALYLGKGYLVRGTHATPMKMGSKVVYG